MWETLNGYVLVREWYTMHLGLFKEDLGPICISHLTPPPFKKSWIHTWAAKENFSGDHTTRYQPCLTEPNRQELTFFFGKARRHQLGNRHASLSISVKKSMDVSCFITALPCNRWPQLQGSDPSFIGQWSRHSLQANKWLKNSWCTWNLKSLCDITVSQSMRVSSYCFIFHWCSFTALMLLL